MGIGKELSYSKEALNLYLTPQWLLLLLLGFWLALVTFRSSRWPCSVPVIAAEGQKIWLE